MRVVIWKTLEIPAMDEWSGTSDLYVTGELEWSDQNRKRQSLKVQTGQQRPCARTRPQSNFAPSNTRSRWQHVSPSMCPQHVLVGTHPVVLTLWWWR